MDTLFLGYIVAAAVGILAGGSMGFVIRGARARRVTERLQADVVNLTEKLSKVTSTRGVEITPVTKPQRWTGTEVAAVLGAVGTVLGVLGAIYGNFQDNTVKQQTTTIQQLEEKLAQADTRHENLMSSTKKLFTYEPAVWTQLVDVPPPPARPKRPLDLDVDNRRFRASCDNPKQASLSYNGFGPSVLLCSGKSVKVKLAKPTQIMLIPAAETTQP